MKDPEAFRRRLSSYQEQHQDLDIYSEEIKPIGTITQYAGYVIGALYGIIRFIFDVFVFSNGGTTPTG